MVFYAVIGDFHRLRYRGLLSGTSALEDYHGLMTHDKATPKSIT